MAQDQWLQQKVKFLLGYYLKTVISGGNEPLVGGVYWGKFWLVRGTSPITQVGKTLSSGFILKIILPRVGIQMHSLGVYKLKIFYYAQRVSYVQRLSFCHMKSYILDFFFNMGNQSTKSRHLHVIWCTSPTRKNCIIPLAGIILHWVNISMFLAIILM